MQKALQFGGNFSLSRSPLGISAAERTMLAAVQPSHWFTAGARAVNTETGGLYLYDRISGVRYSNIGSADPTPGTAFNSKPTLEFTGLSTYSPDGGQTPIDLDTWGMAFVISNLNAGATIRYLIGGVPEKVGAYYPGIALAVSASVAKRVRLYMGQASSLLDATSTYDFAGTKKNATVGFDTSAGYAIQMDGIAAGSSAANLNPMTDGRFILFGGITSLGVYQLPFYGEWAETIIFPYNPLAAANAAKLAAWEAYVNSVYAITFA